MLDVDATLVHRALGEGTRGTDVPALLAFVDHGNQGTGEPPGMLVLQGLLDTGDWICAGHGWCTVSGDPLGVDVVRRDRQTPKFRGLSGRMVPCWSDLPISIPIGFALAGFRRERNQVSACSPLSVGHSNNGCEIGRGATARLSYCWTWVV